MFSLERYHEGSPITMVIKFKSLYTDEDVIDEKQFTNKQLAGAYYHSSAADYLRRLVEKYQNHLNEIAPKYEANSGYDVRVRAWIYSYRECQNLYSKITSNCMGGRADIWEMARNVKRLMPWLKSCIPSSHDLGYHDCVLWVNTMARLSNGILEFKPKNV